MILNTRFDGSYWYSRTYTLGEADYSLDFSFNSRMGSWFLDVSDANGSPIVTSIRLIPNRNLLAQFSDTRLPPGVLFVNDSSGNAIEPGVGELGEGQRCQLVFFTPAELGL